MALHCVVDEVVSASSGSKKKLNQEIGGELMELTRAVVKKHTFAPEKRIQVSPCSIIPYVIKVDCPMEQKHFAQAEAKNDGSAPWTVRFK